MLCCVLLVLYYHLFLLSSAAAQGNSTTDTSPDWNDPEQVYPVGVQTFAVPTCALRRENIMDKTSATGSRGQDAGEVCSKDVSRTKVNVQTATSYSSDVTYENLVRETPKGQ